MVTYANAHVLLKAGGYFGPSGQQKDYWSAGLRIGIEGTNLNVNNAGLLAFAQACYPAFSTFHTSGSMAGTSTWLSWTSAANIGTDGHYIPTGAQTQIYDGTDQAGSNTPTGPWSQALVISLRTAAKRGLASNGRLYWPCVGPVVDADTGRVTTAAVAARTTAAKTFLDAINVQAGLLVAGARVMVVSAGGISGGPVSRYVTSVRMDGRLDQQERRENDLAPVYATATLT